MKKRELTLKSKFAALAAGVALVGAALPMVVVTTSQAVAATVSRIDVRGNQRISDEAVIANLGIRPGQSFSDADIDRAVKALFNTGLFGDVSITRSGSTLVVTVDEQSIVNQTIFQGNRKIKDNALAAQVQTRARAPLTQYNLEADVDAIKAAYANIGRNDVSVTTDVMPVGDGRVNVVFNIVEGDRTKITAINIVGNDNIGDARLRSVMSTKRSNALSVLFRDDVYSEDRLRADEERLARYYYDRGFADFRVLSSSADFDANSNAYNITISVDEGARYNYGDIVIDSTIAGIDTASLSRLVKTRTGRHYSASEVEDTLIALSEKLASEGYPFAQVTPRGDRNFADNTIGITYAIDQGPRAYVERIEIRGNDRTRDYVIRREFDISEGDAFNQVLLQQAKKRLEALGYFAQVNISTVPGSEPDRVIVVVDVVDQSTGEFGVGAGYSVGGEAKGIQLEGSIEERNFLGRGQYLKLAVGGSESSRTYTISFTEPYFMGSRISAGFDIQKATERFTGYNSDITSATVRFGLPITQALSAQLAYNYSEEKYLATGDCKISFALPCNLPTSIQTSITQGSWTKSSLSASLTYDTLDNRNDPRSGLIARGTVEFAGLGGDANFLKLTGSATYYHTLVEDLDLVGLVGIGAGNIQGYGNGLRAFDLFRGSKAMIRGFDNNGFGPYDPASGQHVGGQTYLRGTAEVTFPLPAIPESLGLRGALFADAATLYGNSIQAGTVSNDLKWRASVGVGIAWASPFGPLRFDYAIPVLKEPTDRIREFSFGVSTRF